jgi:ribonucleoside-diphosphate reductase alpha chain
MGATHAEKSTVNAGAMNAVSSGGAAMGGGLGGHAALDAAAAQAQREIDATPASDIRFCSIDNPDCEACQ